MILETNSRHNNLILDQSPKLRSGKTRLSKCKQFSLLDLNPNSVTSGFWRHNRQYEPSELLAVSCIYEDGLKRQNNRSRTACLPERKATVKIPDLNPQEDRERVNLRKKILLDNKDSFVDKVKKLVPSKESSSGGNLNYMKPVESEYRSQLEGRIRTGNKTIRELRLLNREEAHRSSIFSEGNKSLFEKSIRDQSFVKLNRMDSDIFNLRENPINARERFKYKPIVKEYNTGSLSESEWVINQAKPSLYNHSGIDTHPLNPSIKNICENRTEILAKAEAGGHNPASRQKMLSDFIDKTRRGAINENKKLVGEFNLNKNAFRKNSNICGSLYDTYLSYGGLIEKPFSRTNYNAFAFKK